MAYILADDDIIRGGLDIVTDTKKNKTAVRFKPRFSSRLLTLSNCAFVIEVKRDIVIAVIYCYITTNFHCAKRDSPFSM